MSATAPTRQRRRRLVGLIMAACCASATVCPDRPAAAQEAISDGAMGALKLAKFHYEKGHFDKAAALFLEAYQIQPRAEFLFNAARAYHRGMKLDEAEKRYRECLALKDVEPAVVKRIDLHLSEVVAIKTALAAARKGGKDEAAAALPKGEPAADPGLEGVKDVEPEAEVAGAGPKQVGKEVAKPATATPAAAKPATGTPTPTAPTTATTTNPAPGAATDGVAAAKSAAKPPEAVVAKTAKAAKAAPVVVPPEVEAAPLGVVKGGGGGWMAPAGWASLAVGAVAAGVGAWLYLAAQADGAALDEKAGIRNANGDVTGIYESDFNAQKADAESGLLAGGAILGVGVAAIGAGLGLVAMAPDDTALALDIGPGRLGAIACWRF